MRVRSIAETDVGTAVTAEERERGLTAVRAAQSPDEAEIRLAIVIRDIPLDAIEPDPAQPRRTFDEDKLQSLAASIKRYGLLQEPGIVPIAPAADATDAPSRFRLVWGERRWRASRIAGLTSIRCKVLPRGDDSVAEQLRTKEKQWAENMEREGFSPIEEAMAVQDAVDLERKLHPDAPLGELVEKVGAERGLNGIVARNLIALLKTPRCLQSTLMERTIGREVAFELSRHWNRMVADNELHGSAKREIHFRNLVEAWARSRGMEVDTHAMAAYAAETFQDPKIVKATCRKAEQSHKALLDGFGAIVDRAEKEKWTVAKARAALADRHRARNGWSNPKPLPCFEQAGEGKTRLTIYLDRVRDPALGTPEALAGLLIVLRDIVSEIELGRAGGGPIAQRNA